MKNCWRDSVRRPRVGQGHRRSAPAAKERAGARRPDRFFAAGAWSNRIEFSDFSAYGENGAEKQVRKSLIVAGRIGDLSYGLIATTPNRLDWRAAASSMIHVQVAGRKEP
jgi:hypothetical protein